MTLLQRDGSARPSVLSSLLDEYRDKMSKEIEYAIVSAAGTAYEGMSFCHRYMQAYLLKEVITFQLPQRRCVKTKIALETPLN